MQLKENRVKFLSTSEQELLLSSTNITSISYVVEQLLLNSIDAKCGVIEICINMRTLDVVVTDDGVGIQRENMNLIPSAYLTSKIRDLKDVRKNTFQKYGYKGLTLFSISKVSKLTICSRERNSPFGYKKVVSTNKLQVDRTCQVGTTVTCRDIFYNNPVRRNVTEKTTFLETSNILTTIKRYHVVHPHLSIFVRNSVNNQLIYCHNNQVLQNNLVSQEDLICKMIQVEKNSLKPIYHSVKGKFKIYGYFSNPNLRFKEKVDVDLDIQWIYINKLVIKTNNNKIEDLLENEFNKLINLIKVTPIFILNIKPENKIDLYDPLSGYDINSKMISFRNETVEKTIVKEMKKMVEYFLRKHVLEYDRLKMKIDNNNLNLSNDFALNRNIPNDFQKKVESKRLKRKKKKVPSMNLKELIKRNQRDSYTFGSEAAAEVHAPKLGSLFSNLFKEKELGCSVDDFQNPKKRVIVKTGGGKRKGVDVSVGKEILIDMIAINQIDRKFIVTKSGNVLYIFDQHAAAERVNLELHFERKVIDRANKKMIFNSELIFSGKINPPESVECRSEVVEKLLFYREKLGNWGWKFVTKKKKIGLSIISFLGVEKITLTDGPNVCGKIMGVQQMLSYLTQIESKGDYVPKCVREVLASKACRGAIKFGDYLSVHKCQQIIDGLKKCDFPFQCAHGRNSIVPIYKF